MKPTTILASALVTTLIMSALPLQAQQSTTSATTTLNVSLTLTVQNPTLLKSTPTQRATNYATGTVRVTNKDLLNLMGAPNGSTLVAIDGIQLGYKRGTQIVASSAVSLLDVFSAGNSTSVVSKQDVETLDRSFRSTSVATTFGTVSAQFADGLSVSGRQLFDFSLSGIQSDKNTTTEDFLRHTFSDTWSFTMTGSGVASINSDGEPNRAVISGTIRGSGKQTGSLVTTPAP